MTRDEILKRFPNASESFIRQNSGQAQSPEPEYPVLNEPLATTPREEGNPSSFRVSVRSFRKRLIDPDNLAPKFFIDCCRYSGLIPNDTAQDISLEVSQEKSEDERTEITITKL